MKASTPRFLAMLLVVWGLFSMSFPLWRAAQATHDGVFADLPMSYLAVGIAAVLAGLALYALSARVEELANHVATGKSGYQKH